MLIWATALAVLNLHREGGLEGGPGQRRFQKAQSENGKVYSVTEMLNHLGNEALRQVLSCIANRGQTNERPISEMKSLH